MSGAHPHRGVATSSARTAKPLSKVEIAGLRFCDLPLDQRPKSSRAGAGVPEVRTLEQLFDRGLIRTASRHAMLTHAGEEKVRELGLDRAGVGDSTTTGS